MYLVYSCTSYPYEGHGLPDIFGLFTTSEAAHEFVERSAVQTKITNYQWSDCLKARDGEVLARAFTSSQHNDCQDEWFVEKVEMV